MLAKIIKLEDIHEGFMNTDDFHEGNYEIGQFMKITIEAFKILLDGQIGLVGKVKKLEQENSYYPNEEEIRNFKVGGTD